MRRSVNNFFSNFPVAKMSFFMLISLVLLSACNLNQGIVPTPFPTPDLPTVAFTFPENNAKVVEGIDLSVDLIARYSGAGVSKIEFYVDSQLINEASPQANVAVPTFPVKMNWLAQSPGIHVFSAIAYRLDGTRSDETIINIEVVPGQNGG